MKRISASVLAALLSLSLLAMPTLATHKTYTKTYKAKTTGYYDYGDMGPYKMNTKGKFIVHVSWQAEKNSWLASNKLDARLEVYIKTSSGKTVLKAVQKKDASLNDKMNVEGQYTQEYLSKTTKVYFRVYEFCGDGDPNTVNLCPNPGKQDHTMIWTVKIEWKPEHSSSSSSGALETESASWGLAPQAPIRSAQARPVQTTYIENPSSDARLFVQIYAPTKEGATKYPVLVLVPGGNGAGSTAFRPDEMQRYADLGFLAVAFDPDGRGRSTGTENYNGFIHQDGLKAVIEYAVGLSKSDGRVVLVSLSYGVTMATGTLSRYPRLPVVFYMDWEGPADRNDTGGCDASGTGHLGSVASCTDAAFWAEREAATFIKQIRVPYQRLQSKKDHAQPDNNHALLLINNATNTAYGGQGVAPWTRLNDETPNRTFTASDPIRWIPESVRTQQLIVDYLKKFLRGAIPSSAGSIVASSIPTAFELSESSETSLQIFDTAGRLVYSADFPQALHWNGLNADRISVANGVYLAVIMARDSSGILRRRVHKLVIQR